MKLLTVFALLTLGVFLFGCANPLAGPDASGGSTSITVAQTQTGDTADVKIQNDEFVPGTASITLGKKIRFTNLDSHAHTVKFDGGESPQLKQGDTFELVPIAKGRIAYTCGLHAYMSGLIVVN